MHLGGLGSGVTEVLTIEALGAIGTLTGRGEVLKGHLTDWHPIVELERDTTGIKEFQRHLERVPGIEKAGGRMDDETEPPERALALETPHQLVGHPCFFEEYPERELSRMENKRLCLGNRNLLHQVLGNITRIDDKIRIDIEDQEVTIEMNIITRRLETLRPKRLDSDFFTLQFLFDIAIGENHTGSL